MSDNAVLIPAYKPDHRLPALIAALQAEGLSRILLVDDGGGAAYESIFDACRALGAQIAVHETNRGKGAALRTGLAAIRDRWPDTAGIVSADADGQHAVGDIMRVSLALSEHPDTLILGSRAFTGKVPLKSRLGNAITRWVYFAIAGRWVYDTQTGLRGIPSEAIEDLLALPGDRYEWEMRMLLATKLPIREIPIETIYENNNEGSHFSPLRDGLRVYREILRSALPGMVAWLLSLLCYSLSLYPVFSDALSRISHQAMCRRRTRPVVVQAAYIALGTLGVWSLTLLGVSILPARILIDIFLLAGYRVIGRLGALRSSPTKK